MQWSFDNTSAELTVGGTVEPKAWSVKLVVLTSFPAARYKFLEGYLESYVAKVVPLPPAAAIFLWCVVTGEPEGLSGLIPRAPPCFLPVMGNKTAARSTCFVVRVCGICQIGPGPKPVALSGEFPSMHFASKLDSHKSVDRLEPAAGLVSVPAAWVRTVLVYVLTLCCLVPIVLAISTFPYTTTAKYRIETSTSDSYGGNPYQRVGIG